MTEFSTNYQNTKPILIVGGGLAGMAAAVRLAHANIPSELIETRTQLGGRAMSFGHPSGIQLDNCQHVLMRCCTHLLDFYQSIDVSDLIEWHQSFSFVSKGGLVDYLAGDDLPAPAHMAMSLFQFKCLSLKEKLAISLAMGVMMHVDRSKWRHRSFGEWLRTLHQPSGAIEKYWEPVCVSAINESCDFAAADLAMQVFQEGFMRHEHAYEMGISKVPLSDLYHQVDAIISGHGGLLRLGCSATCFDFDADQSRISGVHIEDRKQGLSEYKSDVPVISAVPFDRVLRLIDSNVDLDARFEKLDQMKVSPIAGIHLFIETEEGRPRFTLPHASLVKSPLHWLFNKGIFEDESGQQIQVVGAVVSSSREMARMKKQEIESLIHQEITGYFPAIQSEHILDYKLVIEKRATFSGQPGFSDLRPGAGGKISNLYLAGDYCQSGWPATMEGAVRSGNLAAVQCMRDLGVREDHPAMQLPPDHEKSNLTRYLPQL